MTLELHQVSKVVDGHVHIQPTDLTVEAGTINVLLGPTGSGKTSLMRLMAGLDAPTSGRIVFSGVDVTGWRVQRRNVAMVYQEFVNYPSMTVYDNIASPLRLQGKAKGEIDRAVRAIAEKLKIESVTHRKPAELSGGQQQRCALARALIKEASLVLLDEPLANLDYKLREELRADIPHMFAKSGTVFIYATTEPEEALLLGGNTATLYEGAVCQFGATASVYGQPMTIHSAEVFSDPPMNFVTGMMRNNMMMLGDSQVPESLECLTALTDGTYSAGFRAHDVEFHPATPRHIGFDCRLVGTEITGSETFLHLQQADQIWVARLSGVHDVASADTMRVWVNSERLVFFDAQGKRVAVGTEMTQG